MPRGFWFGVVLFAALTAVMIALAVGAEPVGVRIAAVVGAVCGAFVLFMAAMSLRKHRR